MAHPPHAEFLLQKNLFPYLGKAKRELNSIGMDPLKLLLASAFKIFLVGDRNILTMLLEWEDDCSMLSGDIKESWLQVCLKRFPELYVVKAKYGASACAFRFKSYFHCFLL